MMDRQQFLDRLKQLENADNDKLRNFLNRLLREGLSKKEIAKAAKVHISTISRRLKDTCEHFDIKVEHGGVHEDDLINLFRQFKPDFLHPSLLETTVNSEILNRPQLPNIPSPDHTQELTPLEFIGRDRHQTLTNPQNIPTPDRTHELTPLEFIGRDRDLNNLSNLSRQAKIVLIKGGEGVGKSRLARQFLDTHFLKMIEIDIVLSSGEINLPTNALKQILIDDLNIQPRENFSDNLKILKKRLLDKENPIGILIDSLEPTLNESFQFHKNFRGYDDLLEVLYDHRVSSFTLITSRTSLISQRVVLLPYLLEGLDINSWKQYFSDCENAETSESLIQIHGSCDGNARIMNILHRDITNPKSFNGNIKSYWERYQGNLLNNKEIEIMFFSEINWLRENKSDAYKLFCQMSSQNMRFFSFDALTQLLSHIPESKRNLVVDDLGRTSLIKIENEDSYYLTPVFCKAAELHDLSSDNNDVFKKLRSTNMDTDRYNATSLGDTASQIQRGIENMLNDSNLLLQTSKDGSSSIESTYSLSILPQISFISQFTVSPMNDNQLQSSQNLGLNPPANTEHLAYISQENPFNTIASNSHSISVFNQSHLPK